MYQITYKTRFISGPHAGQVIEGHYTMDDYIMMVYALRDLKHAEITKKKSQDLFGYGAFVYESVTLIQKQA